MKTRPSLLIGRSCHRAALTATGILSYFVGMTLGEMIDSRYTLRVCCEARGCHNDRRLDLESLAERLGRDHGSMHDDLVHKFHCTQCGGRRVSFRISPNVPEVHANWHVGR
jgi:hypothetical protein